MIKISKFRFFEYKTVSVILETVNGNLTVYTALPTDVRLHPTYSKVKFNISKNSKLFKIGEFKWFSTFL